MQLTEIKNEIKANEERIVVINKELGELPSGRLVVEKSIKKGRQYLAYRNYHKETRSSINKESPLLHALARRLYLETELKILKENNKILNKALKEYREPTQDIIIGAMPKGCDCIDGSLYLPMNSPQSKRLDNGKPLIGFTKNGEYQIMNYNRTRPGESLTKQTRAKGKILDPMEAGFEKARREWAMEPYLKSNYHPEHLSQPTGAGYDVRTKNELYIVGRFNHFDVPFRYEEPIFIEGKEFPRYPDFKSIDIYGEEVFWEHCGLMDDEEYVRKHKEKLKEYESVGIVPWKNLIITYDKPGGGIDVKMIDAIIEARFVK